VNFVKAPLGRGDRGTELLPSIRFTPSFGNPTYLMFMSNRDFSFGFRAELKEVLFIGIRVVSLFQDTQLKF